MKRLLPLIPLLALCPVRAQAPEGRVTLQLNNAPVQTAVSTITQQTRTRVLLGPSVAGRVTLNLQDAPVSTAVKTLALVLDVKWRALWLGADRAPRIRPDEAVRLAEALDTVGGASMAMHDGKTVLEVTASQADAPRLAGLRPVYVLISKAPPADAANSAEAVAARPTTSPLDEPPAIAPSNDPDVIRVQRAYASLAPEQQRAVFRSLRPARQRDPAAGRGRNGNGIRNRQNRERAAE